MSIKATSSGSKNFVQQPNLEPGGYPARIARIYDLGVQNQRPYKGDPKPPCHEIMLVQELVDAFMVNDKGEEQVDKPRWITQRFKIYPLTVENANSTALYKALDPKLVHDGDWAKLVGAPSTATVVNNYDAKSNRTFDNIANLTAVRPKEAANMEGLKNEGFFFSLEDPNLEYWGKIPAFVQDIIKGNINYKGSALEALLAGNTPTPKEEPKPEPEASDEVDADDDMPW